MMILMFSSASDHYDEHNTNSSLIVLKPDCAQGHGIAYLRRVIHIQEPCVFASAPEFSTRNGNALEACDDTILIYALKLDVDLTSKKS